MAFITLALSDQEQSAFAQLIDSALRGNGLNALDIAAHFKGRLVSAQRIAELSAQDWNRPGHDQAGAFAGAVSASLPDTAAPAVETTQALASAAAATPQASS